MDQVSFHPHETYSQLPGLSLLLPLFTPQGWLQNSLLQSSSSLQSWSSRSEGPSPLRHTPWRCYSSSNAFSAIITCGSETSDLGSRLSPKHTGKSCRASPQNMKIQSTIWILTFKIKIRSPRMRTQGTFASPHPAPVSPEKLIPPYGSSEKLRRRIASGLHPGPTS